MMRMKISRYQHQETSKSQIHHLVIHSSNIFNILPSSLYLAASAPKGVKDKTNVGVEWPLAKPISIKYKFYHPLQEKQSPTKTVLWRKNCSRLIFIEAFPGLHILVHKIYLKNFHVVLKSGKCQNNRQTTQTSIDLLGLLTVHALEHRVEVHIIPFLASCVIFPMSSVDQKCPFSHSVRKSAEAWFLCSTCIWNTF